LGLPLGCRLLAGQRGNSQQAGVFIEDELESADVAAIDLFRFQRVALVLDEAFAGGTLPGHGYDSTTDGRSFRVRWRYSNAPQ
jgi:hypothetical protein